jgi:hypothetical protein
MELRSIAFRSGPLFALLTASPLWCTTKRWFGIHPGKGANQNHVFKGEPLAAWGDVQQVKAGRWVVVTATTSRPRCVRLTIHVHEYMIHTAARATYFCSSTHKYRVSCKRICKLALQLVSVQALHAANMEQVVGTVRGGSSGPSRSSRLRAAAPPRFPTRCIILAQ